LVSVAVVEDEVLDELVVVVVGAVTIGRPSDGPPMSSVVTFCEDVVPQLASPSASAVRRSAGEFWRRCRATGRAGPLLRREESARVRARRRSTGIRQAPKCGARVPAAAGDPGQDFVGDEFAQLAVLEEQTLLGPDGRQLPIHEQRGSELRLA
jgi:hypothetical protein